MSYEAHISDSGELIFSSELVRALGLEPGDILKVDLEQDVLRIDRTALLIQHLRRVAARPEVAAALDAFEADRRAEARLENEKWKRLGL